MVPLNHPILKSTDPAVRKILDNIFWSEAEGFFVVNGVENIPIEEIPSGYWKYWGSEGINGGNTEPIFHKIVGLNDKITFVEFKENLDNQDNYENDKPNDSQNPPNYQPKELNNKTLLQYFKINRINSIKLEGEKLIIERNDNSTSTNSLTNFPELKGIDKYLQNKTNKAVSRRELELSNNSDTNSPNKSQDNNSALWIGFSIGGVLIITVIVGLLLKKKIIKKH